MEIRNTPADDANAKSERIDITRKNREAIQSRQPLMPKRDPAVQAEAVRAAREQHREKHQERIANARLHNTAHKQAVQQEAAQHAAEVAHARDVYEARVEKGDELRKQHAAAHQPASESADKLELSTASQQLAHLLGASNTTDQARAQYVADVKQLYERGMLNTPDLIARAAYRLLGGK